MTDSSIAWIYAALAELAYRRDLRDYDISKRRPDRLGVLKKRLGNPACHAPMPLIACDF